MSIIDSAKEWLFGIALKKSALKVAHVAAAWIIAQASAPSVQQALGGAGVSVSVDPVELAAFLVGLTEIARNWVKVKIPSLAKLL